MCLDEAFWFLGEWGGEGPGLVLGVADDVPDVLGFTKPELCEAAESLYGAAAKITEGMMFGVPGEAKPGFLLVVDGSL